MRRIVSFIILLVVLGQSAWAVPAWRRWKQFCQSDGTQITVQLQGDERAHWFVTTDMKVVARADNGDFRYVAMAGDSLAGIVLSEVRAHDEAGRSDAERAFVARQALAPADYRQAMERNGSVRPPRISSPKAPRRAKYEGKRRGLFILVEFQDVKFSRPDIHQVYDSICNHSGYSTPPFQGSVGDYFREQSDGKFELDFDVVGPVTVSENESYYGSNGSWNKDSDLGTMVTEALNLVADSVNWADYDWNGDGEADQVFLLYAGYGEAQYGPSWTIWPCEGKLSWLHDTPPVFDGVTVNTFACSCELHGNKGVQLDGIGTICHEFSHCMGLPDFYNTADMDDFCMDVMDLMDQGTYNGKGGYSPAAYTGYERWYCGWRTPVVLTEPQKIEAWQPLVSGGETYILYNQADSTEYYLLDNRQRVGFDKGLYATGMVVTHVHYDADAWAENTVNTKKGHKRMALLPADDIYDYKTCNTDAFPYYYMNGQRCLDSLTDNSRPHPTLFNKNYDGSHLLHKPIYKIRKNEDMTMDFVFGYNPVSTGIRETPSAAAERRDDYIYDLEGRRILLDKDQLRRGIYIVNGKKIIINGHE